MRRPPIAATARCFRAASSVVSPWACRTWISISTAAIAISRWNVPRRGWHSLAVIRPQWTQDEVAALLDAPGVIGVKPYYSLISPNRETRDAHLEASIFDFLPHHILEVVNDRHAWVTLHVPKADRLGHRRQRPRSPRDPAAIPAHRAGDRPPGPLLHRAACAGGAAAVCR